MLQSCLLIDKSLTAFPSLAFLDWRLCAEQRNVACIKLQSVRLIVINFDGLLFVQSLGLCYFCIVMTISSNMDKFIELNIRDFRAIKEADIALNGITVVTGINGCGKSSISKFLYYALKYANDYEGMATEYLNRKLISIHNLCEIMVQEVARFSTEKDIWKKKRWIEPTLVEKDLYLRAVKRVTNTLFEIYQKELEQTVSSRNRIRSILVSTLNLQEAGEKEIVELLQTLYEVIENLFEKAISFVENRPYHLLENRLEWTFKEDWKDIELKEYGDRLVGNDLTTVPIPHIVQKVVYIDTPMIVGTDNLWPQNPHWDDLAALLNMEEKQECRKELTEVIKSEILHGEVSVEDGLADNSFIYTREDGKQFNLLECATGIKSFSIIQLLIKNGFLNEHTLVILDEPEAHLHPQWIVEYARMVVMIHKAIGTKFFIASHSTDMVSAIRYIAEKEGCLKPLSFYLAEEDTENPYQYIYKELRTNIEPIFDSFNKSFDKIEQYGESTGYSTAED